MALYDLFFHLFVTYSDLGGQDTGQNFLPFHFLIFLNDGMKLQLLNFFSNMVKSCNCQAVMKLSGA